MTVRLSPWQLAEPALESCRHSLRVKGECSNVTSYLRDGTPLLTCLWNFPDPDIGKSEVSRLMGRLGLSLGADLCVAVHDSWQVDIDVETLPPGIHEVPRPTLHPDRYEALEVMAVTSAGVAWEWRQRYDRTDDGVAFGEVEERPGAIGPTVDALVSGMRPHPERPAPRPAVVLGKLADWLGPFPVVPLDADVGAMLEQEMGR